MQNYAKLSRFHGMRLIVMAKGWRENLPLAEQALAQRHDDKSSARTTSGCCGHPSETQSFPISRATGLKNATEKERRENGGKNGDGGGEETRPRELLPRRCHVNLIGHIAAKNVSRPHRSRELSISACSCTDACVARDVINISIFQRAGENVFH